MKNELIVLIHGLIRSGRSMRKLASFLNGHDYDTHSYHYSSAKYTIKTHAAHLQAFIEAILLKDPTRKLHFVTHSLGGIVAREALANLSEEMRKQCQCLIMLAPPNHGSSLAKISVKMIPLLSSFIKPLAELSTEPQAYVHQVSVPEHIKIGTIAGRFDIKTPPVTTQLMKQHDFLIINATHTFIMNHPKTRSAILNFLKKGSFGVRLA